MNENMDTKAPVHAFGYTRTIILIKINMVIFVLVLARYHMKILVVLIYFQLLLLFNLILRENI